MYSCNSQKNEYLSYPHISYLISYPFLNIFKTYPCLSIFTAIVLVYDIIHLDVLLPFSPMWSFSSSPARERGLSSIRSVPFLHKILSLLKALVMTHRDSSCQDLQPLSCHKLHHYQRLKLLVHYPLASVSVGKSGTQHYCVLLQVVFAF